MEKRITRFIAGCARQSIRTGENMRQVIMYLGEDGYWVVECPSLPGCISQGKTEQEAITNIIEAIGLWIQDALAHHQPLPDESEIKVKEVWVEVTGSSIRGGEVGSAGDRNSRQSDLPHRREVVKRIDALRDELFARYGEMPDSVELIREDRAR